jgi:amino acid transporter
MSDEVTDVDVLSWGYLTGRPTATATVDGLAVASLLVFAGMFVVLSILALRPRSWGLRRRIGRDRFRRWLATGLWLSSLGLILLILRFLQIDPLTLARPIWLVVILVAVACWIGWLAVMLMGDLPAAQAEPALSRASRRPRKGGSYR